MPARARTTTTAQKAEAVGEDKFSFTYDGRTYHADVDMDLDALEALHQRDIGTCMKVSVGDEEYAEFRKTHKKMSHLYAFFDAYNEAMPAKN
jgi:hypothetical protein